MKLELSAFRGVCGYVQVILVRKTQSIKETE